LDESYVALA